MAEVAAFRNYDFDKDPAWREYLNRVEIPAGGDDVLLKLKAKWYTKNVDTSATVSQLLQQASPATDSSRRSEPAQANGTSTSAPPRSTPSATRSTAASSAGGRPRMLFFLHIIIIACAAASLLPFTGRVYRILLQVNMVACLMKIHAAQGMPRFRPFTELRAWALRAMPTTDFQYLLLSAMFLTHTKMTVLLVPITTMAVYHAVAYADSQWRDTRLWKLHGVKLHRWLAQRQNNALILNAAAEILLGFLLLAQLLTRSRSFMLIYFFWSMLKLRFWAPDTSSYHHHVWRLIGAKVLPYVRRVPLLYKAVHYVQSWFMTNNQR